MIAVFRSRTQLFSFVSAFRLLGGSAEIVSTPHEAGVGCGLSASFEEQLLPKARVAVKGNSGFVGFYKILQGYPKKIAKIP
ncbi:MAG: DUF3343 domain-containing protein [Clostridia bacterium]|nr:DUF3343 domain-containing protein [Clostridia bacterium]